MVQERVTPQEGARRKGMEAAKARQPKSANPYNAEGRGRSFFIAWEAGWQTARKK